MKDLRPPTCRTHSIVTHTTCSSTYILTHTYKRIHYTHTPSHTYTDRYNIVSASTVFIYEYSTNKRSDEACFISSNASLHNTYMHTKNPDEKTTRIQDTARPSFFIIFAPTGFNCHGAIFVLIEQAVNRITNENVK